MGTMSANEEAVDMTDMVAMVTLTENQDIEGDLDLPHGHALVISTAPIVLVKLVMRSEKDSVLSRIASPPRNRIDIHAHVRAHVPLQLVHLV